MVETASDWLYDYTLQFLSSPGWKIPILSFIDEKCCAFDDDDENKFEYTVIHNEFQEVVENLLENICIELGATHEMFYQVVKTGLKNPEKNEKRKHFVKGWTLRLTRFLTKKILPEWVEIIFAKPEGLELAIRKWKDLNCASFFILE